MRIRLALLLALLPLTARANFHEFKDLPPDPKIDYALRRTAKPWSFGPFGRDVQLMGGPERPNRNRSTANAFASYLLWIVRRRAVSAEASEAMMALLARPLNPPTADENQVKEFIGASLPADA